MRGAQGRIPDVIPEGGHHHCLVARCRNLPPRTGSAQIWCRIWLSVASVLPAVSTTTGLRVRDPWGHFAHADREVPVDCR